MRAIILLFDSLNKRYLPPYGDALTKAPNFQRLAAHAATFETVTSAVCRVCLPGGSCIPGDVTSCIGSGGR